MREKSFKARILFYTSAKGNFNFPISGSIRVSFWLPNSTVSTFSEIAPLSITGRIDIWIPTEVRVTILERDFLQKKIIMGAEFKLGVFPHEIAHGEIIEIIT